MMRIAQLLGVALALALNTAAPGTTIEASQPLSAGAQSSGEAWLRTLSDASMSVSERLEVAATDMSVNKWFKLAAEHSAPLDQRGLEQLRADVETHRNPVVVEIYRGVEAMMHGVQLLAVDVNADLPPKMTESFDFTEIMTDPSIPAIVGDEWANFLEGLVAALGAALLHRSNPALAQELATAFADRMQRVPRLIALGGQSGFFEVRDDSRNYISKEDLQTLARDTRAAELYVSRMGDLADHGPLS